MRRALLLLVSLLALRADAATVTQPQLHAWLEEAFAAAADVPQEDRRDLAYSLDLAGGTEEARIRKVLFKLALRPSSPAWWDLLRRLNAADRAVALPFLEGVYRTRAGVGSDEQRDWQQGLAEMLFCTGRLDEALPLQRQVVARGASSYGTILLAIMERVAGNAEPFERLQADPPPSGARGATPAQYLTTVVNSVSSRMMRMLGDKTPRAMQEMLTGTTNWPDRMHALEVLRGGDPKAAEPQLAAVLADPAAPEWAKDDAIYSLAHLRSLVNTDPARVLSLVDCWLSRRGVTMPAATAETWARVAALKGATGKEALPDAFTAACYRHHRPNDSAPPSPKCLEAMATLRMMAATNGDQFVAARQSAEWIAAQVLESGAGLGPLAVWLGITAELAPSPAETARIFRYTATLDQKFSLAMDGEALDRAVRTQTDRHVTATPWDDPAPRPAAARCP